MSVRRQFLGSTRRVRVVRLACLSVILLLLFILNTPLHQKLEERASLENDYIPAEDLIIYGANEDPFNDRVVLSTRPALVAATRATQDIAWMEELISVYDLYPYNVDDRHASSGLTIPTNKGHEAMVYLTYIITHYSSLPPCAIFVHGHNESWHQEKGGIVHLINSLQTSALQEAGYVSLRCDWYPSCPAELKPLTKDTIVWGTGEYRQQVEDTIGYIWDRFFPGVPIPQTIASQCGAQFAVTRESILRHSRERYAIMRDWLRETKLDDEVSGRVMEKLWAYIMTGDAVHCPSPHSCACNYFRHCENQKWTKPPKGLGKLPPDSNII